MQKFWDNPATNAMPAEARVPAVLTIGTVRIAPATETTKPVFEESTKKPVKTNRAGKAGIASANLW